MIAAWLGHAEYRETMAHKNNEVMNPQLRPSSLSGLSQENKSFVRGDKGGERGWPLYLVLQWTP